MAEAGVARMARDKRAAVAADSADDATDGREPEDNDSHFILTGRRRARFGLLWDCRRLDCAGHDEERLEKNCNATKKGLELQVQQQGLRGSVECRGTACGINELISRPGSLLGTGTGALRIALLSKAGRWHGVTFRLCHRLWPAPST